MALWEDRSGRHPGCARRFPHDSAVAAPMRRGAGRNDPPRAPESESDGVRRAPRRARGRCGSADHETARMASAPTRSGSVAGAQHPDGRDRECPDALGVGGRAPARPRGPTPTTTRPRTPPDTPDEPPTTPRTRSNRLRQCSGQHHRSSPSTAPSTTGARTRVCYASFRLLRPSTLHCTRKESVVEGEGAQQTERSAAEGEAGAAGGEAGAAAGNRTHRIACRFRRSRASFPPVSAKGAAGLA